MQRSVFLTEIHYVICRILHRIHTIKLFLILNLIVFFCTNLTEINTNEGLFLFDERNNLLDKKMLIYCKKSILSSI